MSGAMNRSRLGTEDLLEAFDQQNECFLSLTRAIGWVSAFQEKCNSGRQLGRTRAASTLNREASGKVGYELRRAKPERDKQLLGSERETMNYRPDIDGLRAVAVLAVVFYHAGFSGVSGGYIGVDVFFVISGYLITRILLAEMLSGRFSVLYFYERRVRRLLPALFAMLMTCFIVGWAWLGPEDYAAMARSGIATLLFASNIWFWQNSGGYFGGATDLLPLLHTWSLAVEEQFYILFPLFLLLLLQLGRRTTLAVTLSVVAISLLLAIWATPRSPSASFYLLPTRAWELGVGSLLALNLLPYAAPRWARESAGALGLIAILWAVAMYDGATEFPGLAALPPVLGTAALIWAGSAGGCFAGQILSWRPVVFVGLISYSLYLWHWPIMAFARNRLVSIDLPLAWQLGTITLSIFLAWMSWRCIERPSRNGRGGSSVFAASAAAVVVLGVLAVAVVMSGGAEWRYSQEQRSQLASLDSAKNIRACGGDRSTGNLCTFGDEKGKGGRVLLWGDSHAEALLPAVDAWARTKGIALDYASASACAPLPELVRSDQAFAEQRRCLRFNKRISKHAASGRYQSVLLHARWPIYVEGTHSISTDAGKPIALARSGDAFPANAERNASLVSTALSDLLKRLTAANLHVVLIGPVPELPWNVGDRVKASVLYDTPLPPPPTAEPVRARQASSNAVLTTSAERESVYVLDLTRSLCGSTCPTHDNANVWYRDDNHLSPAGAVQLALPVLSASMRRWPKPFVDADALDTKD